MNLLFLCTNKVHEISHFTENAIKIINTGKITL